MSLTHAPNAKTSCVGMISEGELTLPPPPWPGWAQALIMVPRFPCWSGQSGWPNHALESVFSIQIRLPPAPTRVLVVVDPPIDFDPPLREVRLC